MFKDFLKIQYFAKPCNSKENPWDCPCPVPEQNIRLTTAVTPFRGSVTSMALMTFQDHADIFPVTVLPEQIKCISGKRNTALVIVGYVYGHELRKSPFTVIGRLKNCAAKLRKYRCLTADKFVTNILAEIIEWPGEIDEARANAAKQRAEGVSYRAILSISFYTQESTAKPCKC